MNENSGAERTDGVFDIPIAFTEAELCERNGLLHLLLNNVHALREGIMELEARISRANAVEYYAARLYRIDLNAQLTRDAIKDEDEGYAAFDLGSLLHTVCRLAEPFLARHGYILNWTHQVSPAIIVNGGPIGLRALILNAVLAAAQRVVPCSDSSVKVILERVKGGVSLEVFSYGPREQTVGGFTEDEVTRRVIEAVTKAHGGSVSFTDTETGLEIKVMIPDASIIGFARGGLKVKHLPTGTWDVAMQLSPLMDAADFDPEVMDDPWDGAEPDDED